MDGQGGIQGVWLRRHPAHTTWRRGPPEGGQTPASLVYATYVEASTFLSFFLSAPWGRNKHVYIGGLLDCCAKCRSLKREVNKEQREEQAL